MAQRILVVEDHDDLRQMFADALSAAGYVVTQARDGFQALRQIDGNPPSLIVLDLRMPFFSGVDVRQELAANVLTRRIPVIVVSGSPDDLGDVPVDCLLKKPVYPEALVCAVQKCLAAHDKP